GTDAIGEASANVFRQGLEQLGWVEGRNIRVDYRFAAGDPALYKTYADELVGLRPDAILAGATPAVAVLQPMTRTIPIVFVLTADPVGQGFVQSLARPGGNITGFGVYVAPMMGNGLACSKRWRRRCGTLRSSSIRTLRLSRSHSIRRSKPPHSVGGSA